MVKGILSLTAASVAGIALGAGCASARPVPFTRSVSRADRVEKVWEVKAAGAITDLSVSGSGGSILVATAPEREIESSADRYLLSRLDGRGKPLWRQAMGSPVKSQAVARDGSLQVVSTYDDRVVALDPSGRMLWSTEGTCKPLILNPVHQVICYHDDDAEPEVAFDVYGWKGEKLLSFPIANDVLALKVSPDETSLALAMTRGQVLLIGAEYRALWQRKVDGEVRDVAVSSGPHPNVVVLHQRPGGVLRISAFDAAGKSLGTMEPRIPIHELQFTQTGDQVYAYGNSPKGHT